MTRICCLILVMLGLYNSTIGQSSGRTLYLYSDTRLKDSCKNYEEFEFQDSAGNDHTGRLFMPNDSQFYFLNKFNERKSKTYSISEIYAIRVFEFTKPNAPVHAKHRTYLHAGHVILIIGLGSYIGAAYLLIREAVLLMREGPKHNKNPKYYGHWVKYKDVKVKIVSQTDS